MKSVATTSPKREVDLEHPWLGLESFEQQHEAYFFGRNVESSELLLRISTQPLTIFYGRSGLGKTSILRAGLLPRLRTAKGRGCLIRLKYSGRSLGINEHFPGPAAQILAALFPQPRPPLPGQNLPADPSSELWLRLHQKESAAPYTHLIIDQTEEVFTLGKAIPGTDAELRDTLALLLDGGVPEALRPRLSADRKLLAHYRLKTAPFPVLLALRDDYVFALNRWRRHLPTIGSDNFELGPLRGLAALDAIYEPGALRMTYRMEGKELVEADAAPRPIIPIEVARHLVRRLANASDTQPLEEIAAVPPLLSVVCQELNAARFRTVGDKEVEIESQVARTGDAADPEKILRRYYEQSFIGRPTGVQTVIEDELLSGDGYRQPRTPKFLIEKFVEKGMAAPEAEKHLDDLLNRRLLSTNQLEQQPRYELTHDVLAPIVAECKARRQGRQEASRKAMWVAVGCMVVLLVSLLFLVTYARQASITQEALARNEGILKKLRDSEQALAGLYLGAVDDLGSPEKISYALHAIGKSADSANPETNTMLLDLLLRTNWMLPLCTLPTKDKISFANFNHDGAVAVTVSRDNMARLWSIPSGSPIRELPHDGPVISAEFSSDGQQLVTATEANKAYLWRGPPAEMVEERIFPHDKPVRSARFSPDGNFVVTASSDGTAKIWSLKKVHGLPATNVPPIVLSHREPLPEPAEKPNGQPNLQPNDQQKPQIGPDKPKIEFDVVEARFSPNGAMVVTASLDHTARLWDVASGKLIQGYSHGGPLTDVRFSPKGDLIVTASEDGNARVWPVAQTPPVSSPPKPGEHVNQWLFPPFPHLLSHAGRVNSAAFDQTGDLVVTSSQDQTARIWADSGSIINLPHKAPVTSASFSPTTSLVMTVADRGVQLWQARSDISYCLPMSHDDKVQYAEFSPDGSHVITTSPEGDHATVWDVRLSSALPTVFAPLPAVRAVSFDAAGDRIAAATNDGLVVCDRSPRELKIVKKFTAKPKAPGASPLPEPPKSGVAPLFQPIPQSPEIPAFVFADLSPDGKRLVVAPQEGMKGLPVAQIWNLDRPDDPPILLDHEAPLYFAKFSADGLRIVTLSEQGACVWDWQNKTHTNLPFAGELPMWADLDANGGRLALATGSSASWYDARTMKLIGGTDGARGNVYVVRFSPNGNQIVTAGSDNAATVWDVASGKATASLKHKRPVRCAAFSADGERLVTATASEVVIWDWQQEQQLTAPIAPSGMFHLEAKFDSSGRSLLLASYNGPVSVWDLGKPQASLAPEVFMVAEALAGASFQGDSRKEKSLESLAALRRNRAGLLAKPKDDAERLAQWFLSPRQDRTISPFSPVKSKQYIDDLLKSKLNMGFVLQAYQLDPLNPELRKQYSSDTVLNYIGQSYYYRQPFLGFGPDPYVFSMWTSDLWRGPLWSSNGIYRPSVRPGGIFR